MTLRVCFRTGNEASCRWHLNAEACRTLLLITRALLVTSSYYESVLFDGPGVDCLEEYSNDMLVLPVDDAGEPSKTESSDSLAFGNRAGVNGAWGRGGEQEEEEGTCKC